MKTIHKCPVCQQTAFKEFLKVKDFMLTKRIFTIDECENCGFHFTNPIPLEEKIADFYKSEKYVSHSSNKKGLINYLYNIVRKKTLHEKAALVRNEVEGNRLLDIGSGTGHFLKTVSEYKFNGIGLEPDPEARNFAHKENGVRSSAQEELYRIENNSFDIITMWHVLEHVYNLDKDIKRIYDILDSNGRLVIAVPNMNSFDARHYKSYWAAYDVPRHLYHFKEHDIARLLLNYGFQLKKVIPMKYDAYYISMLSEKYRTFLPFFGVFIGWLSNMKAKKYGYSSQIYIFAKI